MWAILNDIPVMTVLLWRKRALIWALACRDFSQSTQGTYLGVFWAYFQPLLYVVLITLVFSLGLRNNPGGKGVPYVVFLIAGMIPWQFLSGALQGLTGIIQQHGYLVSRGDFPLLLLPVEHLLSRLFSHGVLMLVVIALAWGNGFAPGLTTLQLLYYLAGSLVLLLGLGLICCSTSLFLPDVGQFVAVLIQFGFWFTPIFWNLSLVPERYRWIFRLNPWAYIIEGYRKSLLGQGLFWEDGWWILYFWSFSLLALFLGAFVFRRLKPHFGEVVS